MKLRKILATVVAAATAVTALTATASAYTFKTPSDGFNPEKDGVNLSTGWSNSGQVPAEEFKDLTADKYVKVTFETDPSVFDIEDHKYLCIKPLYADENDAWQWLDPDGKGGPVLSEPNHDTYALLVDWTEIYFKVPEDKIDIIKEKGMPIMGHGITLKTLELVDEAPAPQNPYPEEDSNGEETTSEAADPAGDAADGKDPVNTGIEGVAVLMGVGALAAAAIVISKKRK